MYHLNSLNLLCLEGIPCSASLMRSQLRHSWLANQILNKSENDILFLRNQGNWAALNREFDIRINETLALADFLEAGFSPAQLIDYLPDFVTMDDKFIKSLKKIIHDIYLRDVNPKRLSTSIKTSLSKLKCAVDEFRTEWNSECNDNDGLIVQRWENVRQRALTLDKSLEVVPTGIVLP